MRVALSQRALASTGYGRPQWNVLRHPGAIKRLGAYARATSGITSAPVSSLSSTFAQAVSAALRSSK